MNIYLLLTFAFFILYLQGAGYFLLFMPRSRVHLLFAAYASLFAINALSVYLLQLQSSLQWIYLADRVGTMVLAISALTFNWLIYELQPRPNPLFRRSIILVLLPLTAVSLFMYVKDVESLKFYFKGVGEFWLFYFDSSSSLSFMMLLLVALNGLLAVIQVYNWDLTARTNIEQIRSRAVLIAVVYFVIIGLASDFAWPIWSAYILPPIMHLTALPLLAAMFFVLYGQSKKIIPDQVITDIAIKKMDFLLLFLDEDGEVIGANQRFLTVMGFNMTEIQELGVDGLTHSHEGHVGYTKSSLKMIHLEEGEWVFKTKDGFLLEAKIQVVKIHGRFGRLSSYVIIGKDCREQAWLKKQLNDCLRKTADLERLVREKQTIYSQREQQLIIIKNRQNQELHQTYRADSSNKKLVSEKEHLISEMHHRVKNNMQICISLAKFTGISDHFPVNDRQIFDSITDRVERIASIHDMIYAKPLLSEIDFALFLRELISFKEQSSAFSVQPQIRLNAHQLYVAAGKAIPAGIIAEELIDNAFRHAFTSLDQVDSESSFQFNIWVNLSKKGDDVVFRVHDNGIGIAENHDHDTGQKIGLHLVKMLAKEQLNGKTTIDRSFGTSVEVTFPIQDL